MDDLFAELRAAALPYERLDDAARRIWAHRLPKQHHRGAPLDATRFVANQQTALTQVELVKDSRRTSKYPVRPCPPMFMGTVPTGARMPAVESGGDKVVPIKGMSKYRIKQVINSLLRLGVIRPVVVKRDKQRRRIGYVLV